MYSLNTLAIVYIPEKYVANLNSELFIKHYRFNYTKERYGRIDEASSGANGT